MNKKELKKLKTLLESKLAEVTRNIEDTRSGEASGDHNSDTGAFISHPADISGDTIDRERSVTMLSRNYKTAASIKEALNRIEEGTYGVCESCGQDIPVARLRARPHSRLCIECKQEQEKSL
jgi:DnaK suppressor protein